jgi:hypothetical protein
MTKDEALKLALEALESNRRAHHYCEDTWYSCPKHEDGCANDSEGDQCNCKADKANAVIDKAITAIREALAQPEPTIIFNNPSYPAWLEQQRLWVGLTDEDDIRAAGGIVHRDGNVFFTSVEQLNQAFGIGTKPATQGGNHG